MSGQVNTCPPSSHGSDLYRRIKRRLGRTFRRLYHQRCLVLTGKPSSYQFPGIEGGSLGHKGIRTPLPGSGCFSCDRQYYGVGLHKQRRRHAFRISMCSPVETPVLVQPQRNLPESPSHSGPAQCDSRQTIPTPSGHSDGVVSPPGHICPDLAQVASSQGGSVCDKVQPQTTSVCIPSSLSQSIGCGCVEPVMGGAVPVCISTSSSPNKCPDKGSQPSVPKDDNSGPGLAKHALVVGSSGDVIPNTGLSSKLPGSPDSAFQRKPSQGSALPEPSCLAPRAKNIREQGFSDQVATRIEAPQRRSTRFVYEAKWAIFVRWCKAHQVDFHSPSVEQIVDFLLHLFQDKKLQPSTIEGYRSAIADKVGNFTVNISKNENLNRLLDSFHRDRPKGSRGVPSWNLSLVLHQLTKAPFEPLRKVSLKHLTFMTVMTSKRNPLMLLESGMNSLMMCAVQHQLPPSERSLRLICMQKPIRHSLPCHPVSPWYDLAISPD